MNKTLTPDRLAVYQSALEAAEATHFIAGIRSELKEAAHQRGIPYGDEMARFVEWAEARMGIGG